VPTYYNYGRTLLILGRYDDGIDALLEAIMRSEGDPGAEYMRPDIRGLLMKIAHMGIPEIADRAPFFTAMECHYSHQWKCALDGFGAMPDAPPGSTRARAVEFFLARSLGGKGLDDLAEFRFRGALAELERAVELRPDDADTRLGLGFVLFRLGRLDEARAQFLAFRRLEPVPGSFFYGAARPDNDFEGALGFSIVEAYVRLVPDDAQATAARAAIRRRQHGVSAQ